MASKRTAGGGDDLEDDDAYLSLAPVRGPIDNDDSNDDRAAPTRKRIRSDGDNDNGDDDSDNDHPKSRSRTSSNLRSRATRALVRRLPTSTAETQAAFFVTFLQHHHSNEAKESDNDPTPPAALDSLFPARRWWSSSNKDDESSSSLSSFGDRLQTLLEQYVPKKRLKVSPTTPGPRLLILCLSARRAVALLKECAPLLRMRAAKLFPKNGSLTQQLQYYSTTTTNSPPPPPLAVGTPHRVGELAQKLPHFLDAVQLIVLDGYVSDKGCNVCTLTDTAGPCAQLFVQHVQPQIQRRKDLHLAFV